MQDTAKIILAQLDTALRTWEHIAEDAAARGELATTDTFGTGYALGKVHALMGAYDAIPDYLRGD